LGRQEAAIASYNDLLAARPDDIDIRNSRASALKSAGRLREALADCDIVLDTRPQHVGALVNRGNIFLDLRRPEDAIRDLRRAHELHPQAHDIHTNLIFALNFDVCATVESLAKERADWASHLRLSADANHPNERSADRKLRIGYVSSLFRHQASAYAFGGVIVHHDPEQFEIICYSDTVSEDDFSQHFRRRSHKWRRTADLSDEQLVALIRKDRIDILVDLVGHMQGSRLRAFAMKPAPIQVTAWGEPTGTGLKEVDYLLADQVVVPTSERSLLTEQVVNLTSVLGFWSPDALPEPGPLPALERGYVTFASFNRLAKTTDQVLRLWSAILRAVPRSRLILKDRLMDEQRDVILGTLAKEGVAPDRVTLHKHLSRMEHFAEYRNVDIALDPFPHGGGMTTLEALWMGVPVLTCLGATFAGRVAASLLAAVGLEEMITRSLADYEALALKLATDPVLMAAVRAKLARNRETTALFDTTRLTRHIETAYKTMWERHQSGLAPAGFAVDRIDP
jgi:predicted O-linked N-acetylglucosamine transferase (SPINDLY family)